VKRLFIAVILLIITFGCSSESSPPDELIDEQTYEQMFMEFAIINQLDQRLLQKNSQDNLRQIVYEHYNVTEEEFRISHEYYERQVDAQLERVKEMSRTLRTERDSLLAIQRQYEKLTTPEQVDSLRQVLLNKE
jgi:DNA-binding ferritin-like protein